MTTNSSAFNSTPISMPAAADDEIDLAQLAGALKRQWKLIGIISLASFLIAAAYTYSRKPTWEGRFDIVLKQPESNSSVKAQLLQSNPALSALIGGGGVNQLETQVEILNSTSVLNPIFQYVRSNKPINEAENMRFDAWAKKDLEIKLKKGTSILNVSYKDSDKSIIIPVLQRLSRTYQLYSGKDRRRGLQQGVKYLGKQVVKYQDQSNNALRNFLTFSIANNLPMQLPAQTSSSDVFDIGRSSSVVNSFSSEDVRNIIATRVRSLKQQISLLDKAADTAIYSGLSVSALNQINSGNTFNELRKVEAEIANKSMRFTDADESVQNLRDRRKVLISFVNQETRGILNSQLVAAESELANASRPKNTLIKFRELQRIAAREEGTLLKLEESYRGLLLDAAREEDPWELISTPTLLDNPVAPKKVLNLAIGLMVGLVLSSGAALLVDRRKGLIWNQTDLMHILGLPILVELDQQFDQAIAKNLQPLVQGLLAGNGSVGVLSNADINSELGLSFKQQLSDRLQWLPYKNSDSLNIARSCDHLLIGLELGKCSRKELELLNQQCKLLNLKPDGIILIKSIS